MRINKYVPSVFTAEALACLQVVNMEMDLGLGNVIIKGNTLITSISRNAVAHILAKEGLYRERSTYLNDEMLEWAIEAVERDKQQVKGLKGESGDEGGWGWGNGRGQRSRN
ncbi:hypothetical protein Gotur_025135 [Gossypium turneri]